MKKLNGGRGERSIRPGQAVPTAAMLTGVLAGAPLALSAPAQPVGSNGPGAPDAVASSPGELQEVIVTAERRQESVLDVPYNISAVSGEHLETANITDPAELIRTIPGLATVDRGYRNSGVLNGARVRGLNVDSATLGDYAVSTVPTLSTYLNDTPIYANVLLKDIERVEVLRGPQGTLYGSGSLGGTIRYILREPKLGDASVRLAGTSSQTEGSGSAGWTADGTLNVPLGETAAFRGTVSRVDLPGTIDYVNLYKLDAQGIPVAPKGVLAPDAEYTSKKDADFVRITYARGALRWNPVDSFDVTASLVHQSDNIGGRRQPTPGLDGYGRAYGRYENGSVMLEPSHRDVDIAGLEGTVDLGFATLTSSSSYYDHSGSSVSENTGFYAHAGFLAFYYNYPRPMAEADRTYGDRAFVQELRLVSKSTERIDYVLGLFYQDQHLESSQDSFLRGFKNWFDAAFPDAADAVSGDQDFLYRRHEHFTDRAIFGELGYNLTDALKATLGVRHFNNESGAATLIDLPAYVSLSSPTHATFDFSDRRTLLKGNLSWKLAPSQLLYGTVSEGYRRGGTNAVPTTGHFAEDPSWQTYGSDSVVNYELGVKGRAAGVTYGLAVFDIEWKDVQINTATPNWGFFAVQNGGRARSKGLELEISGSITRSLRYSGGYAYTDAVLTQDVFAPTGGATPVALKGAPLPGSPRSTLNLTLDYLRPINSHVQWTTEISGSYQSGTRNSVVRDPRFNVPIDGFAICNLSTGLAFEHWEASLFVKNVTNARAVTGEFTNSYMGTDPADGYYGNGAKLLIGQPRTAGLSIAYSIR